MAGASIETTLELWASSLRDVKRRMHPLFTQDRVARSAEDFLDGLLGEEQCKTGWMRVEAAGDPGPWRQQAILGRGRWDADAYGVGDIEMALRRAGKGYVLGMKSNDAFHSWGKPSAVAGTAKEIADRLPLSAWKRLSAGAGTNGERLHDWAYLELADLDGGEYDEAQGGQVWTRGLLIRRKIVGGDLAFFTTWAPSGTRIETLAKIEGHRWAIEDSFETAKNELGLNHNETRSWLGWRRHVSLVMLAFAMMATIRVHANGPAKPSPKKIRRAMTTKAARPRSTAH